MEEKIVESIEYRPAFNKMGFDEGDFRVLEAMKKYMERYRMMEAREKMGGSKNIHCPETEVNPPTPF